MSDIIRIKRGLKSRVPKLLPGEPALAIDTGELFVGGPTGNILVQGGGSNPSDLGIEVLNVKQDGAVGDGVFDNTTIFQEAIDSVSSNGGGVVYIPKGTYIIKPIFMKPNVTLMGAGIDVTILKYAADGPNTGTGVRMVSMDNNTVLKDLTCNGNSEAHLTGSEHMHCVFIYEKKNVLIDGCKLTNARGDGISITGGYGGITSEYVVIQNCMITFNNRAEIVVEQVSHLKILNNYMEGFEGCVHFEPFANVELYDAVISGNTMKSTVTGSYVISLRGDGDGTNYNDIVFTDNYIDSPNGHMLLGWVKNVVIANNTFKAIKEIYAWYYTENVTISDNHIKATETGITITAEGTQWSKNYTISNNMIYSGTEHGIYVKGAEHVNITGNKLFGTNTASADGIYVWATKDVFDIQIHNNEITGYGFSIHTENYQTAKLYNISISNNLIHNGGMEFEGLLTMLSVTGNMLVGDTTVYGIVFRCTVLAQGNISIVNNTLKGWTRGIYLNNAAGLLTGVLISNNFMTGVTTPIQVTVAFPYLIGGNAGGVEMYSYNATPEAFLTARPGTMCVDSTNGRLYVKQTGTGNTGWVGLT